MSMLRVCVCWGGGGGATRRGIENAGRQKPHLQKVVHLAVLDTTAAVRVSIFDEILKQNDCLSRQRKNKHQGSETARSESGPCVARASDSEDMQVLCRNFARVMGISL